MADHLSFSLDADFVETFRFIRPNFGFPIGAGNSLGELNWLTKYARLKEDGTKERWFEGCRRVVEGVYSILKDHCLAQRTPWNEAKAQRAAEDMYARLFAFKWTPPGRGLWMMGTPFVMEHGSAALQNCAFLSTKDMDIDPIYASVRLMEMSMLGIGVGFDTLGANKVRIHTPTDEVLHYTVPDSREGWCESTGLVLASYLTPNHPKVELDYSKVRPAGEPIKGFGGVAAGPGPLKALHESLRAQLWGRGGQPITSTDIVDIKNKVGKCVVSGNVRRSAELALGDSWDKAFLDLKNWNVNPTRMGADGWGNLSNNSIAAEVGGNYESLAERIAMNGEPGLVYLDLMRSHGRLADPPNYKDYRVMGVNPCGEQALESGELCTLVETYPINCADFEDYRKTLKAAYLYAKTVTLLPTHWPESNEVMARNRRIGCSNSGHAQFAERYGWTELRTWLDHGYNEIISRDRQYSEWLGVRESIKMTSVKPSGTVSLLAGVTPGVHWPQGDTYIRRIRFRANDELLPVLQAAGYPVEADVMDPTHTAVVAFPTLGPQVRPETEVSVWEKAALAALLQKHWADNQVSATLTFDPDTEASQIEPLLRAMDGQLKTMSFLPLLKGGSYAQMPYESISREDWELETADVSGLDTETMYGISTESEGDRYCSNDRCELDLG